MNEHRLDWHEQFSPLGPALRSPTIVIDHKAMELDAFRFGSHEVSKRAVAPSSRPFCPPRCRAGKPTCTFRVGDRVRIARASPDRSEGFANAWVASMDRNIGDEGVITWIDGSGVRLHGFAYCWPPLSLELIPAQPEQVAESPAAASDGEWVAPEGGRCPVDGQTPVEVRLRNGIEHSRRTAAGWGSNWSTEWSTTPADIVAYRVVKQ